jgi:hypothetical protein
MIHIPGFIKIGSGIQKSIGWDSCTHRQHGDLTNLVLFYKIKEIRLNTYSYSDSPFMNCEVQPVTYDANILHVCHVSLHLHGVMLN